MHYLKPIIILFGLYFSYHLNAQTSNLIAVRYAETITTEELEEHLTILSSDEFEGREAGTHGELLAAYYLAGQFAGMALPAYNEGSYFQEFPLERFVPAGTASIGNKSFHMLDDFVYFNAGRREINIENLLFCGYGIDTENYNDFNGIDVRGKSVIIFGGEPVDKNGNSWVTGKKYDSKAFDDINIKYGNAVKKGIQKLFVVYDDFDARLEPYRHMFEREQMKLKTDIRVDNNELMVFLISKEMAIEMLASYGEELDKLKSKISKKGKSIAFETQSNVSIDTKSEMIEVSCKNVLGYIEGSDLKDEVIVITAHYDHIGKHDSLIYNGADDDGSGTVALIEIAEAFAMAKQDGYGPRRSILVMPVSAEEKGLLGSKHYTNNPVFPLDKTVANLNIDMIGRVDENHQADANYVYLIGSDGLSKELHDISEWANSTYVDLALDYTYNAEDDPNNFYLRSDHYSFAKMNIPIIFYFSGVHEDYHQPTDTEEKINYSLLKKRTDLVFYTTWELANRDERPKMNNVE